jgi:hypothetical protein
MQMANPFRPAGRARRIEPEGAFVRARLDRAAVPALGEFGGEIGMSVRRAADHEHRGELRQPAEDRRDHRQELARHEQRLGAAVGQDDLVIIGRKQRVERHRHDAGLQRAPEDHRKLDLVEHDHRSPILAPHPVPGKQVCHAAGLPRQVGITQPPPLLPALDEGNGLATPRRDMPVDEIGGGVAVLLTQNHPPPECDSGSATTMIRRRICAISCTSTSRKASILLKANAWIANHSIHISLVSALLSEARSKAATIIALYCRHRECAGPPDHHAVQSISGQSGRWARRPRGSLPSAKPMSRRR